MRRSASALVLISAVTAIAAGAQPYVNVQINARMNNPEETSIAINPVNPDNVIAVAQSPCHYYATFDGGSTWTDADLSDPFDLGDPAVVFDAGGYAYYCYIGTWSHSGIFINRSTDGGSTWMPAGTAVIEHAGQVPFDDKAYPVADWTASPTRHNLYVSWTQFSHYGSGDPADSSLILFSRSIDRGMSFSTPIRISDRGGDAVDSDDTVEGAVPAVGPDGTVYVAWAGPRGIEFDRSTDGGISFGPDRIIADQPGGWDFDVSGIYRCNGLPVTKADFSPGPYRGRVYVNWSDQRNGDTDVFLIHSDDQGATWSAPRRVNDDPPGNGKEQFFTWFDVDPLTGTVYVLFYDRREQSGDATDVYLAISEDGGEHFQNLKLSESPFVPNPSAFFGDYSGISAFGGRVRPIWTRMDDTVRTIWTALIDRPSAGLCVDQTGRPKLLVYPNPARDQVRILCCAGFGGLADVSIRDIGGRLVRRISTPRNAGAGSVALWDGRDEQDRRVAAGIYFVGGGSAVPSRIVVTR